MSMSPRFIPVVVAATLFLTGCGVESKNPLSTPGTSTIDTRLEGIYGQNREKSSDELEGWHFHYRGAKAAANGQPRVTPFLEVLHVVHAKEGGLRGDAYHALTTHLGGHDYISFAGIGPGGGKGQASSYGFARYEVSWSGDLRVWLVSADALARAIKAGKLHGTVKHHEWLSDDVYLTDSTERLAAFVAASDPAVLFSGKPLVFHRLAR